ncbi:MAG: DUF2313 domain-containing protein [Desulfovibrio sp.]|nr:DUF2313 domain-containing protein [Desulfovibrio sp.]
MSETVTDLPARDAGDYLSMLRSLLPRGIAWSRSPGGRLSGLLHASAEELARLDAAVRLLPDEVNPLTTLAGLEDWERVLALPDECLPSGDTLSERREAVLAKLRDTGRQDMAYWYELAATLGWNVTIEEHWPFICGISQCGDPRAGWPGRESGMSPDRWEQEHAYPIARLGVPEIRYWWHVIIHGQKVRWFRCGESVCPERLLDWDLASVLECLMRRDKEAHTLLTFEYREEYIVTRFRCGDSECGDELLHWEYDETYY